MGLAPYGAEICPPSFLSRDASGRLQFRAEWKDQFRRAVGARRPYDDRMLAARVQMDLEEALVERMRRLVAQTGLRTIAYTGGLALNSAANERILRETGIEHFYILPASNDAGTSIGAAAAGEFLLTGNTRRSLVESDFLGYAYGEQDCKRAIEKYSSVLKWSEVDICDIVERLVAGQVIGLYEGGSEFGPRALGHRSILADASRHEMWQYINQRIKFREAFRPLAPAVPVERAREFFEMTEDSPYMLRVVRVREPYRTKLAAITHVDGSARVQTVDRRILPRFHDLLTRYGDKTGLPILVNTSLNVCGQPIVETPLQAIELLLATHLDALVLGPFLVQPKLPRDGEFDLSSSIQLAPQVEVICESKGGISHSRLIARARGNREYQLDPWIFQVLAAANGKLRVRELFDRLPTQGFDVARSLEMMNALLQLRLILMVDNGDDARRIQNADGMKRPPAITRGISGKQWEGLAHILTSADGELSMHENLRTCRVDETLAKVWSFRRALGITRIADITGYDHVGIPVVAAIRPAVSDLQITATQGKGLRYEEALVSALLEAIERFSASSFSQKRLATLAEIQASLEDFYDPTVLGGTPIGCERIEWVLGTSLRWGRPVWLPAAEVLFPYFAPESAVRPMRPSTTGLAAGNTLAESILHAIYEVVERDTVSRYLAGAPGRLVDLRSVPDGPERDLIARFSSAGVQLFVADLSALAPLPVYFAATWCYDGVIPMAVCGGQAASLSSRIAFRRAMLEAAQSRVVAIQGSREDLIRHASSWERTAEAAEAQWERARDQAQANGMVELPSDESRRLSMAEILEQVLNLLNRAGFADVLVTNLTHATIGIPVVHVTVPGMVDSIVDPERKRRVV